MLHLPTTIWYIVFCYAPMFGVVIAFKNYRARPGRSFLWSLIHNSDWVGFENFQFLFNYNGVGRVFFNTVFLNILFLYLGIHHVCILLLMMCSQ